MLCVVVAATAASGLYLAEQKRNRFVDIKPRPVTYTTDAQTIERGRYRMPPRAAAQNAMARKVQAASSSTTARGTRLAGPNITSAGVVARYQPEDWNSVIRHGVKPNGHPALVMPSEDHNQFTQDDLNALVSARQLPAQQGTPAVIELPHPAWVLYGLGAIPDAAARIDHQRGPRALCLRMSR